MSRYPPPDAKKVLILAPHPDDETLGCGGTIALYTSINVEVRIVVISNGQGIDGIDKDVDVTSVRRKEAEGAASILGAKDIVFLGFPSRKLELHKNEIKDKLVRIIKNFEADIVFAPSPVDFHQDHITVADIAFWLKKRFLPLKVAFYEIYNTVRHNFLVDITDVMHIKEKAILNYKYSLLSRPEQFLHAIKGLNIYRSFYTGDYRYYEAYWTISEPRKRGETVEWLTFGMRNEYQFSILNRLKRFYKSFIIRESI